MQNPQTSWGSFMSQVLYYFRVLFVFLDVFEVVPVLVTFLVVVLGVSLATAFLVSATTFVVVSSVLGEVVVATTLAFAARALFFHQSL
tara:strand:- start:83 stop:346 length:264 start_codon:yes stop_codon:yes gene_type:complete